jgi:peptidoglycan/LPS O-acetylase OafA/YrhL
MPEAPTAPGDGARATAPPVVAPPPGHPRFPLYDSLRGVAAIMVLIIHCMGASGALTTPISRFFYHFEVSITLLFMLSAFLLYRPFVAARMKKAPSVAFRDYALRRVLRIVPGYYLALIVLGIYPGLTGVYGSQWWVYFGFLQIYNPLYDTNPAACGPPPHCGIAPAWTLGVEIAFYVLLPFFVLFMAWAATRVRRPVRFELAVLSALGVTGLLTRFWAFEHLPEAAWTLQTFSTLYLWLVAGMLLAVVSARIQGRERESRLATFVTRRPWAPWTAAIALYAMLVVVLQPTADFYGQTPVGAVFKFAVFTVITVLLLLPATFGSDAGGWPRRFLANRFIAWVGLIAYGVYLYHMPIAYELVDLGVGDIQDDLLRWAVLTVTTLAAAIACGAASYYLWERRFLRLKYRRGKGSSGRARERGGRPAALARRVDPLGPAGLRVDEVGAAVGRGEAVDVERAAREDPAR